MEIEEIKTLFGEGKIDIRYRFLSGTEGNRKWTGWRSFRRTVDRVAGAMWPWENPASKVEWKPIRIDPSLKGETWMKSKMVTAVEHGTRYKYELRMYELPKNPQKYFTEVIVGGCEGWVWVGSGTAVRGQGVDREWCQVM